MFRHIVPRWLPSLVLMFVIFMVSAQPADRIPDFDWADRLVKKGGHMLGYGLIAVSYWNGLGWERRRRPLAWGLAVLYAVTDEYHQSFVPGRNASVWDVVLFDNLGAFISLWIAGLFIKEKRPDESA